jgi:hypothetical protein
MAHRGNGLKFRGKPREQLYSRISKNEVSGCWNWLGALFKGSNYGQFCNREVSKSPTTAHRASWEIHKGPIPAGKMVCHTCDNRKCVNPEHLYLGTNSENMRDRSKRGYVHQMRLDEAKVREMRQLRQIGWSWRKLAARYGVHVNAVVEATTGKTWAYVDEPVPTIKIGPGRRNGRLHPFT